MDKKVQIKVMDNGSLKVTGDVELIDMDGNQFPVKPVFLYADAVNLKECHFVMPPIKGYLNHASALKKCWMNNR